jgi:HEAT repeat protein
VPRIRYCVIAAALALGVSAGAADIGKFVEQLSANDREQRREAGYQLTLLGAGAKPALPALIKALDDADRQVWAYAVTAIANLGPEAKDAVPKLLEGLDSQKSRGFRPRDKAQTLFRSAFALTQIGDAAKPELIASLKAEDTSLRLGAAKALGGMGPKAADAVPALIENLGHADGELRTEIAESLASIGKDAVAPLTAALGGSDAKVRAGSARALGVLGHEASSAGPQLLEKAGADEDPAVRAAALAVLPRVGLAQEKVVPVLIAAVKQDQPDINRAAIDGLLLVRPAGKVAVPALLPLLKEPPFAERAATILGRYGSEARSAVPAILSQVEKAPDGPFAQAVVAIGAAAVPAVLEEIGKLPVASVTRAHWTLRVLGAIGAAGLPEFQKALAAPSVSVRLAALLTIQQLGLDAREARHAVIKLTTDAEPAIRAGAVGAVVAVGVKPPQAFEPVEAGLADRVAAVRLAAASAAGVLGPLARPLAGKVAALLSDPDADVRIAAVRALGTIGGGGEWTEQLAARLDDSKLQLAVVEALAKLKLEGVAPKLIALYPKAERPVRVAILEALSSAGDAGKPTLESALQDDDRDVRAAAVRAMAQAQPNLETFVPVLATSLGDSNAILRQAAADATSELAEKQSEKLLPLVEPLVKLASNDSERTLAIDTLRSLRVRDLDAIGLAIDSPVVEVRIWGVERLGSMGAGARPARSKLEELMNDQNEYVRRASRRALQRLGR